MFLALFPWQTFGDRPRFKDSIHLQTKIIMKPTGVVFLDHKPGSTPHLLWQRFTALGLSRSGKIPLGFVFAETHGLIRLRFCASSIRIDFSIPSPVSAAEILDGKGARPKIPICPAL